MILTKSIEFFYPPIPQHIRHFNWMEHNGSAPSLSQAVQNQYLQTGHHIYKSNDFLKSRKTPFFVISRICGESSLFKWLQMVWTPVFTGVTTFYELTIIGCHHFFI